MRLRWKKRSRVTGLAAVGAGSSRPSDYHDGSKRFATVYPLGGDWRGPLRGWYFVCSSGEYRNTCDEPAATEAEAKAQAEAWVKKYRPAAPLDPGANP